MSQKTKDRLARLNIGGLGQSAEPAPPAVAEPEVSRRQTSAARRSPLVNRENALGRVTSGKQRVVHIQMHDTARIRMWHGHNRDYDSLSESRCRDLIESFKRVGRQEFPAIVRRISDSRDHDFELICGARRHWTASFLGWDLLVEVRDLNDKQAFILQDIENRDREDISDYERALDYRAALPLYFDNNQSQMAQFLEIDKSNFGKLLELTGLPKAIVSAYADMRELKTHHGTIYRQLLADNSAKKRVLERAQAITEEPLAGKQVMVELKKAAAGKPLDRRSRPKKFGSLTLVRESATGKLAIDCQLPKELNADTLKVVREDFESLLKSLAASPV